MTIKEIDKKEKALISITKEITIARRVMIRPKKVINNNIILKVKTTKEASVTHKVGTNGHNKLLKILFRGRNLRKDNNLHKVRIQIMGEKIILKINILPILIR